MFGYRLNNANFRAVSQASDPGGIRGKRRFSHEMTKARKFAIARWYKEGGTYFLDWVKKHYRTWSGEPLRWSDPFAEEFFLLLGNPWLADLYIEKSGQVGWTEGAIAFNAFVLAEIRIPVAYGVEMERKLGDIVGPRVQTAFDHCAPIQELKASYREGTGRGDTDTKTRQITVGGVVSTYFYASTAGGKSKPNERQASSALSSFTAFAIIADEIELWPIGSLDVARQRQEGTTLPTKPFRGGSTPGIVGGVVDSLVKHSKYLFQWQVICPSCRKKQFLDAFGNLLKPVEIVDEEGNKETVYIDIMGRPLDWFYRKGDSEAARTETAYVGCQHCAKELPRSAIAKGKFICANTGLSVREFHDDLLTEQKPILDSAAMRLPKLAVGTFNAAERIRRLLKTRNPADEIQQGLGKAVSVGGGRINLERLLHCCGRPIPAEVANWEKRIVIGCDQGLVANIVIVQQWWLPDEYEDEEDRWYRAFVETIHYCYLSGGFEALHNLAIEYGANIVGIDSAPEIEKAGNYARSHPLEYTDDYSVYLFDQVKLSGQKYKKVNQNVQGEDVPMFRLHRTAGLDAVRDRIYGSRYRLPDIKLDPTDDENFLYHYQTSERFEARWVEPPGEPDHFFHADNFASMAMLVDLVENPAIAYGGVQLDQGYSALDILEPI